MKIALTSNEVVAALALPAGVQELKFFDHGHPDCVVGFGLHERFSVRESKFITSFALEPREAERHSEAQAVTFILSGHLGHPRIA